MNSEYFKHKYHKYKLKYLKLKMQQTGGKQFNLVSDLNNLIKLLNKNNFKKDYDIVRTVYQNKKLEDALFDFADKYLEIYYQKYKINNILNWNQWTKYNFINTKYFEDMISYVFNFPNLTKKINSLLKKNKIGRIYDKKNFYPLVNIIRILMKPKIDLVALQLIYNYYRPPVKLPRFISGPIRCIKMENKNYKIYLFGEYHSNKLPCKNKNALPISEYLDILLKNSPVFIDLFLENSLSKLTKNTNKNNPGVYFRNNKLIDKFSKQDTFITNIGFKFTRCSINSNKYLCDIINARIHNIDIRSDIFNQNKYFSKNGNNMIKALFIIYDNIFRLIQKTNKINLKLLQVESKNLIKFLLILKEKNINKIKRLFNDSIKSIVILNKEFNKTDKKIRNDIIKYSSEYFIIILERFDQYLFDKIIHLLKNNIFDFDSYYYIYDFLQIFFAIVTDLYSMFRLFKKYNTKTDNHPNFCYNSIIYSGNGHTNNYYYILKKLGFIDKNIGKQVNNDNCLELFEDLF